MIAPVCDVSAVAEGVEEVEGVYAVEGEV